MNFTEKQLKAAFEDMIDVMCLLENDQKTPLTVPKKCNEQTLVALIKNAAKIIEDQDKEKFSEETKEIIEELTQLSFFPSKKEDKKKPVGKKSEPASKPKKEEVEKEESKDEPEIEDDPNEELRNEIEDADNLKELREIFGENEDLFEGFGFDLKSFKKTEDLRKAMLDALPDNKQDVDDTAEPDEEPKPTKKPAKQSKSLKDEINDSKEKKVITKVKGESFSRMDSVAVALKTKKPKTVSAWIEASDSIYEEHGGKANEKETLSQIQKLQKALPHFDIDFPTT